MATAIIGAGGGADLILAKLVSHSINAEFSIGSGNSIACYNKYLGYELLNDNPNIKKEVKGRTGFTDERLFDYLNSVLELNNNVLPINTQDIGIYKLKQNFVFDLQGEIDPKVSVYNSLYEETSIPNIFNSSSEEYIWYTIGGISAKYIKINGESILTEIDLKDEWYKSTSFMKEFIIKNNISSVNLVDAGGDIMEMFSTKKDLKKLTRDELCLLSFMKIKQEMQLTVKIIVYGPGCDGHIDPLEWIKNNPTAVLNNTYGDEFYNSWNKYFDKLPNSVTADKRANTIFINSKNNDLTKVYNGLLQRPEIMKQHDDDKIWINNLDSRIEIMRSSYEVDPSLLLESIKNYLILLN